MKTRQLLLGTGLALAAWFAFFGDKTPSTEIAEPAPHAKMVQDRAFPPPIQLSDIPKQAPLSKREPVIQPLQARKGLIGNITAKSATNRLFASKDWTPPPPKQKSLPPPPPTAPPLPFSYLGKKFEDGKWEIYLGRGTQSLILREQIVIDDMYRVDAIKPPTLTLTYLPLNQTQSLFIGGYD